MSWLMLISVIQYLISGEHYWLLLTNTGCHWITIDYYGSNEYW